MYAIVEVGSKQFTVKKGDVIEVERQDAKEQTEVTLDQVLLLAKDSAVEVGQPVVKGAQVSALVLEHCRGDKKLSFKYRRRKNSRSMKGHRQNLTRLQIKEISG